MRTRYDAVIIGAGHNGLVCACYLAKAGLKVAVLEKRPRVGGCASTNEDIFPGYKISEASYVNSLFLTEIVEDLELRKYGYEVIPRNPSSFTPLPDGRYLLLGPDKEFNRREIAKFSFDDSLAYEHYEAALERIAEFVSSTLTMTPRYRELPKLVLRALKLGPASWYRMARLAFGDPVKFLDSWYETDALKATELTGSLIGATDLNGYVLLHHMMGDAGGARGIWGYQRGGMGGLSESLAAAARTLGVEIFLNHPVSSIDELDAKVIVSSVDPNVTFNQLCPDKSVLPRGFVKRIADISYDSASMKVNLIMNDLPEFRCLPDPSHGQHHGTIHMAPSVQYILDALRDSRSGVPSARPVLEMTIPSTLDDTLAPEGKHVANIFVQFTPYDFAWDRFKGEYFRHEIMNVLREYITNIDSIIDGVHIHSPKDLEREFGITGGNIFHGSMDLSHLFLGRPVRGHADYRTPVEGLYLCGSGTHPGGGVTGANGYNAAREIIKDLRK